MKASHPIVLLVWRCVCAASILLLSPPFWLWSPVSALGNFPISCGCYRSVWIIFTTGAIMGKGSCSVCVSPPPPPTKCECVKWEETELYPKQWERAREGLLPPIPQAVPSFKSLEDQLVGSPLGLLCSLPAAPVQERQSMLLACLEFDIDLQHGISVFVGTWHRAKDSGFSFPSAML